MNILEEKEIVQNCKTLTKNTKAKVIQNNWLNNIGETCLNLIYL